MCTITYFPAEKGNFIVTDNRDESVLRPAHSPKVYSELETALFYPKDLQAGGTWFGASKRNRALCLMNGAFKPHQRKSTYRLSRGVMVKELLAGVDFLATVNTYQFQGIEPFYALAFLWHENRKIYELIWNGSELVRQAVDADAPHIWASSMTYSKDQLKEKEKRFTDHLNRTTVTASSLWDFHHDQGEEIQEEGLIIDRGILKTTSVIQLEVNTEKPLRFHFHDLMNGLISGGEIDWKD